MNKLFITTTIFITFLIFSNESLNYFFYTILELPIGRSIIWLFSNDSKHLVIASKIFGRPTERVDFRGSPGSSQNFPGSFYHRLVIWIFDIFWPLCSSQVELKFGKWSKILKLPLTMIDRGINLKLKLQFVKGKINFGIFWIFWICNTNPSPQHKARCRQLLIDQFR